MHKFFMTILLSLTLSLSWAAQTENTLILPAGPGSTLDLVGRTLITANNRLTNKQLIPLNRPGADGILSVNHLLDNPKFLLLGNTSIHAFNYYFREGPMGYTNQDFEHISFIGWAPQIWYASRKSNIQSLQDFKKAISGNNTLTIAGDNTLNFVNIDAVLKHYRSGQHIKVRYKSAIDAVMSVAGGDVDLAVGTLTPTLIQMSQQGRVTILAASSDNIYQSQGISVLSMKQQLDVPQFSGGYILSVSSKMPNEQKEITKKTLTQIMNDPETVSSLRNLGVIVVGNNAKNVDQIIDNYRDAIATYR